MHKSIAALGLASILALGVSPAAMAAGEKVSVITPFLAAIATGEMIEAFKAKATEYQWGVDVVDTAGDMAAFASRVEDATTSGANAIVLVSVDPAQIQDQVDKAKAAGVPVITIDGAKNASSVLNVTSDNYVLGETMTKFLFDQIGNKGNIVRFFYSAHPGVHQRELALDAALKANPEIKQVADHYVAVPGQVDDSRAAMDAMLLANPGDGAINAVWAAWDEPGIGANLAIEAAGRKGIVIAGIDGNPQAIDLIKACSAYVGTVRQGFGEMANIAAGELNTILAGGSPKADELYAPVELITRESLGVSCP
ncbi:MAG TPA: substrate-binding domain-containing protein [Devosia sp.]|jgi:ribose transport system substrate-binding protein|uniref:substrate-binding domain-containing protein n=1 Tax=Devosia sp. TaxID=1871048 RepID=UPI002DDD00BB|nr:substrate-binding domain-containing protein [Devosia sp.]HEV2515921.1 substrate-binding domain-containing protein [Devosia sp.]